MDRLFIDTNVMLDLLGEREPFYNSAAILATLADKGKVEIFVSALSFSTVFYILSKYESTGKIIEKFRKFRVISKTADLTNKIIDKALTSDFTDFEDAMQYFSAIEKDCNLLISRNVKDFKMADIPVLTPDEYLSK